MRRSGGRAVGRSVSRLVAALRSAGPPVRLTALLLLAACQPQARRVLLLDLALSEPAVLNGTVQPWRDEGYAVEYRRFYPHLARSDLERYRVLLFLLGREPEAPSDALTAGDLALLTEWVLRGGSVARGDDADGEGYLDRWTANRGLDFARTGISLGDRLLEDTTMHTPTITGHPQPWAEGRAMGDEPLGSVFDPFPLDRNNVLATRDSSQVLAVTSRHAFVRAPRTPAPRAGAGVVAATRLGDGLVVVISRHALGALGPQFRPTTAPVQQLDALERTDEFLHALARWTRRPAEWAHVPPAARGVPLALGQAPAPVELVPPAMTPPRGVDTMALPLLPDRKLARATSAPEWLRQQGMRVLWMPLFATRDGRRAVRSSASLDSLVALLDAGGFNLFAGDAGPESADSLHVRWEERDAVRRAWADAVKRLQPTSVAWIPLLDYRNVRHAAGRSGIEAAARSLFRFPAGAATGRLVHARPAPRLRSSRPATAPVHTGALDARSARAPARARSQHRPRDSPGSAVVAGTRLLGRQAAGFRRKRRVLAHTRGARRTWRRQAPAAGQPGPPAAEARALSDGARLALTLPEPVAFLPGGGRA